MTKYKRMQVVFSPDDVIHMELYNWIKTQTKKESEFIRNVLLMYKEAKTGSSFPSTNREVKIKNEDVDAMMDML